MKAPVARHERAGSHSAICVICLIGVLVSLMSLGSLRLYGLYLEHRLAYVTMKIESINNKNTALEQRYSTLMSPSRIYSYAKSELKMITATEIETIRLNAGADSVVAFIPEDGKNLTAPSGMMKLFVGSANAKD